LLRDSSGQRKTPPERGFLPERLKRLELSTFCMATEITDLQNSGKNRKYSRFDDIIYGWIRISWEEVGEDVWYADLVVVVQRVREEVVRCHLRRSI
jgi:hypothetical protein